jgi:hypothetical protein
MLGKHAPTVAPISISDVSKNAAVIRRHPAFHPRPNAVFDQYRHNPVIKPPDNPAALSKPFLSRSSGRFSIKRFDRCRAWPSLLPLPSPSILSSLLPCSRA